MTFFHHEWLGYVETSQGAINLIQSTGIFYLLIAFSYALAFLLVLGNSRPKKMGKIHMLSMSLWLILGVCLLVFPSSGFIVNAFVMLLSTLILYQSQMTSALGIQATLPSSASLTNNKRAMYAQTCLNKTNYTITHILEISFMNEKILWILILYRAIITTRASWNILGI